MQHLTLSGKFATADLAIENIREMQLPMLKPVGDWKPVIVSTQISPRKTSYGIQFWTPCMIEKGYGVNSDSTVSVMVG